MRLLALLLVTGLAHAEPTDEQRQAADDKRQIIAQLYIAYDITPDADLKARLLERIERLEAELLTDEVPDE